MKYMLFSFRMNQGKGVVNIFLFHSVHFFGVNTCIIFALVFHAI